MNKNIAVKVFFVFCIFVQLLALLPHHHHEGDEMCIDLFGCSHGTHLAEGQSCCGHSHEPVCSDISCSDSHSDTVSCDGDHNYAFPCGCGCDPLGGEDNCALSHIDLMSPGKEKPELKTDIYANPYQAILFFAVCEHCLSSWYGRAERAEISPHRETIPIHIAYISRVLQPRAPAFTA